MTQTAEERYAAERRESQRKVALIVGIVLAVLLSFFAFLTATSSLQLFDFGPSRGTISYEPELIEQTGEVLLASEAPIHKAAFSFDGKYLVNAYTSGKLELRELASGSMNAEFNIGAEPIQVAFSPNSALLLAASEREIYLWDVQSHQLVHQPIQSRIVMRSVIFSADGQRIQTAGYDGSVLIWQIVDAKSILERDNTVPPLEYGAAFNEHGTMIAYYNPERGVVVWSLEKDKEHSLLAETLGDSPIIDLTFSHLGGLVASMTKEGKVYINRTQTGELVHSFQWQGGQNDGEKAIVAYSFSADARLLALGGSDGQIELWDVREAKLRKTIPGNGNAVRGFGFSDNGDIFASLDVAGLLRIWTPKEN
jgi:WD40 repeat protein